MKYRVCPYCAANLDFGEKCDCDREARHGDDKLKNEKEKNNGYERIFSLGSCCCDR